MFKILFTFIATFMIFACNNTPPSIDLVVKSEGGDKKASILLQEYFTKNKIQSTLTQEEEPDIEKFSKKIIFMGQTASLNFIKYYKDEPIPKEKSIFLYSHIINQELLDFVVSNDNVKLITTESEKQIYQDVPEGKIISIPLAVPTYLKSEGKKAYIDHKDAIDEVIKYPAIHLGGSYKNPKNQDVVIDTEVYSNLKNNLQIEETANISVILHPRTFNDILNDENKIHDRLLAISGKNGTKNTHFFAPANLYNKVKDNIKFSEFKIYPSPNYTGILYAVNTFNVKEQFVSVDQYNAFADIKIKVHGFLLNQDDVNQSKYLEVYSNLNVDIDMLKNFLSVIAKIQK